MSQKFQPDAGLVVVRAAVHGHTLPPSTMVDGVIGLDYFRGKVLTIDFDRGLISLTKRRRRKG